MKWLFHDDHPYSVATAIAATTAMPMAHPARREAIGLSFPPVISAIMGT